MNDAQCIVALDKTLEVAGLAGYVPRRDERGTSPHHLAWMAEEIRSQRVTGSKAMRWLGYIQGVVVMADWASLEEVKEASRSAVHGDPS